MVDTADLESVAYAWGFKSLYPYQYKDKKENKMSFLVGIIIGAFIGWNIPQPSFAKKVQQRIKDKIKSM